MAKVMLSNGRMPSQLLVVSGDPVLARELRALLASHELPCSVLAGRQDCVQAPLCHWFKDAPLSDSARIQAVLHDAISVLEQTRHAFKSRELGQLRLRLSAALRELSGRCPVV